MALSGYHSETIWWPSCGISSVEGHIAFCAVSWTWSSCHSLCPSVHVNSGKPHPGPPLPNLWNGRESLPPLLIFWEMT